MAAGSEARPVLYSFRRCPYAIRARLALAAAGWRPGIDLELREVNLRARPPELLEASARATVPVLVLPDGQVLAESLEIMQWALQQQDPHHWLPHPQESGLQGVAAVPVLTSRAGAGAAPGFANPQLMALLRQNDGPFKHHLDRFKYPDRQPQASREQHRRAALAILADWSRRLEGGGWLLGARCSLADLALLPFVRQFRLVDPDGFAGEPQLAALQAWLQRFLASPLLAQVMEAPWGLRSAWPSPRWLYHLALAEEWRQARAAGVYRRSTRGRSLDAVGFIHASHAHQLQATWQRFYADAGAVVLLSIDPARLAAAGVPVRLEPAPGSGELFPHLYGPLPLEAVLLAEPYRP